MPVFRPTARVRSPSLYLEEFASFDEPTAVEKGGLSIWFFTRAALTRAFELMEVYADHPMDLADASIVVAAELLGTRKVFTLDRNDFETYRVRRGHRYYPMEIVS